MDKLVNYSSEDEQDEKMVSKAAERASPYCPGGSVGGGGSYSPNKARRYNAGNSMTADGSGGNRNGTPIARNNNNNSGNAGGGNYRDEESYKQRSSSSYGGPNRQGSYHTRDNVRERDERNGRDFRDGRDSREVRHNKEHNRYDHKNDRARNKDYNDKEYNKGECKRDRDYDKRHPPRDDDRNRYSTSSYNKTNRFSGGNGRDDRARHDASNSSSNRYQNYHHNRDDRVGDHYPRNTDRSGGKNRRRSNSRSPSPTSSAQYSRNKRPNRNEKQFQRQHTRNSSRSRSRSHSASPTFSSKRARDYAPIEQARHSALEMERKISSLDDRDRISEDVNPQGTSVHKKTLLELPLNDSAPRAPNVIAVASSSTSASNNGSEPSVIQLPSYYNPNVINPNRYAEQVQKRKLLWGAKKSEDTAAKWGSAQFSEDTDGKVASKFMRLMGIKGAPSATPETKEVEKLKTAAPDVKSREAMFSNMEQQYEVARQATHTMRGVGLGFSSQSRPF